MTAVDMFYTVLAHTVANVAIFYVNQPFNNIDIHELLPVLSAIR